MTTINAERGGRLGRRKGMTILTGRQSHWWIETWTMAPPRISKEQWGGDDSDWTFTGTAGSDTEVAEFGVWFNAHTRVARLAVHPTRRKENNADPAKTLRQRLDNANNHFRKKAAAVFGDGDAVRLLARLYQAVTVDLADFDACKDGVSLAKLTAANFCEIGAKSIYITEAGQNFIDAINSDE